MRRRVENTGDLRRLLIETINGVRDGSVSPQQAQAIAGLSSQILRSAQLDLEAAELEPNALQPVLLCGPESPQKTLPEPPEPVAAAVPVPASQSETAEKLFEIISIGGPISAREYADDFGMTGTQLLEFAGNHPWFELTRGLEGRRMIGIAKAR